MRAQTSTEFIVIVSAVLIILLIIVFIADPIGLMAGNTGQLATQNQLRSGELGINHYFINDTQLHLVFVNNMPDPLRLLNVSVGGSSTSIEQGFAPNQRKTVIIDSVETGLVTLSFTYLNLASQEISGYSYVVSTQ